VAQLFLLKVILFGISRDTNARNVISGIIWNKKRYKCKECNKYFRAGEDNRVKYSKKEQEMAFILYTEGNGFRRIASILSKLY
jgi:transposase-like protein